MMPVNLLPFYLFWPRVKLCVSGLGIKWGCFSSNQVIELDASESSSFLSVLAPCQAVRVGLVLKWGCFSSNQVIELDVYGTACNERRGCSVMHVAAPSCLWLDTAVAFWCWAWSKHHAGKDEGGGKVKNSSDELKHCLGLLLGRWRYCTACFI